MATVKFYDTGLSRLKSVSIQAGWFDTGQHPGYPGRHPNVTVAEVAMFNTKHRNFAALFVEKYFLTDSAASRMLALDIRMAIQSKVFTGTNLSNYMLTGLLETIRIAPWPPNTPAWLKFKMKHGLALDPLIASQVMLDEVTSRVIPL